MTAIRVTARPCQRPAGTSGSPACPVLDPVPRVLFPQAGRRQSAARLWASHRDEIDVGGCAGCVVAATTAAASSAILGCEKTKAKGVQRGWAGKGRGRDGGTQRGWPLLRV